MNGFEHFYLNMLEPHGLLLLISAIPTIIWQSILKMGGWVFFALVGFILFYVGPVHMGPIWVWATALFNPNIVYVENKRPRIAPNPFVSVVVAALNEEQSIGNTLNSILNAGYDNLEIIVVDDGSRDDTMRVAQRIGAQVGTRHRRQKIRVFRMPYNSGKPTALNLGARMAKGEFVALIDADSEIQHGAFHRWIEAFSDPRVGAVAGNVRVMNPEETLVTRLQEVEYASMMTLVTLVLARLRLLAIIHGQGGMVRAKAGASIGWYDAGLGDDTDLSVRLLKAGWKLGSCTEAVVYTHVPSTFRGVVKQRRRWMKNRVRVRASKHYDMASVQLRYGLFNSLVGFRNLIRLQEPGLFLVYLIVAFVEDPLVNPYWLPGIMSGMYIFATIRIFVKALIARDFCGTPAPRGFVLIPLLPLYLIVLRFCVDIEILLEGLRINRYVPYVPRRIWPQVPPW